jgi:hypothetical protein
MASGRSGAEYHIGALLAGSHIPSFTLVLVTEELGSPLIRTKNQRGRAGRAMGDSTAGDRVLK